MGDREWKRFFLAEMTDVHYEQAVRFQLQQIQEAIGLNERQSAAGTYRRFRRITRNRARCILAKAMMEQLNITPTLDVAKFVIAKFVMQHTFGQTAANEKLDRRIPKRGSDISEKFMDEARTILTQRGDQVARYGGLYEWFCRLEDRTVERIKRKLQQG